MKLQIRKADGRTEIAVEGADGNGPVRVSDQELGQLIELLRLGAQRDRVQHHYRGGTMITIRASSVPRISVCAASAQPPSQRVNWSSEYSRLGTATHRAFESHVQRQSFDLDDIAKDERVEVADLRRSFGFLLSAWSTASQWFPEPQIEKQLEWTDQKRGITLTGKPDVVSVRGKDLRVGDWKSGFIDRDAGPQLKAYCFLAAKQHGCSETHGIQINTRLRGGEGWQWSIQDLEEWWDGFAGQILSGADKFSAGTHCQFCQRWAECPAGRKYLRQASEALIEVSGRDLIENYGEGMEDSRLVELAEQRKMVADACDLIQAMLKREVCSRGGQIVHADGKRSLVITETTNRPILFDKGEAILRDRLGDRLAECLSVKKGAVEEIVKADAPRGGKGHAVDDLMERLDEAGALGAEPVQKLEIKRPRKGKA